jgi:hypothetical protein
MAFAWAGATEPKEDDDIPSEYSDEALSGPVNPIQAPRFSTSCKRTARIERTSRRRTISDLHRPADVEVEVVSR